MYTCAAQLQLLFLITSIYNKVGAGEKNYDLEGAGDVRHLDLEGAGDVFFFFEIYLQLLFFFEGAGDVRPKMNDNFKFTEGGLSNIRNIVDALPKTIG